MKLSEICNGLNCLFEAIAKHGGDKVLVTISTGKWKIDMIGEQIVTNEDKKSQKLIFLATINGGIGYE